VKDFGSSMLSSSDQMGLKNSVLRMRSMRSFYWNHVWLAAGDCTMKEFWEEVIEDEG
jgi:hypothetical protein